MPSSDINSRSNSHGSSTLSDALMDSAKAGLLLLSMASFEAFRERPAEPPSPVPSTADAMDLRNFSFPSKSAPAVAKEVSRIEVTKEGQAWMEYQIKVAENSLKGEGSPRLVDGTVFLSATADAGLKKFVGAQTNDGGLKFVAVNEAGYKYAFVKANGEKWYISESPYYPDQYPNGTPFRESSLEMWKASADKPGTDKMIQKEFFSRSVFDVQRGIVDFNKAAGIMKAAEDSRASELADRAGVRKYNLTRETIGYLGLVDGNTNDPIMDGLVADTRYFPQMLNSLKDRDGKNLYNVVSPKGSEFIRVETSPVEILRSNLKVMHQAGIRNFYLNLAGHGNESGIYFAHKNGHERLSPNDLHNVFSEFKDCKFVVDTVACYGGGMADKMKAYRDPSDMTDRVFMKLQAKPFSYNQEGRLLNEPGINGAPKVHSSYYQIFNAYYLMKGESFGEAHYKADIEAKKLIPCDAEGWFSGRDGGRQTAKSEKGIDTIPAALVIGAAVQAVPQK